MYTRTPSLFNCPHGHVHASQICMMQACSFYHKLAKLSVVQAVTDTHASNEIYAVGEDRNQCEYSYALM